MRASAQNSAAAAPTASASGAGSGSASWAGSAPIGAADSVPAGQANSDSRPAAVAAPRRTRRSPRTRPFRRRSRSRCADEVFDASDRPGATAETSAAKPAVSAAVPAITQRRVRPTRTMAASRASAADDLLLVLIRCSRPIMTDRSRESALSKTNMRIAAGASSLLDRRQFERERRSVDHDPPAVPLDDRRDDREPEPRPRSTGRAGTTPEPLEQPVAVRRIRSRPLIAHGDQRQSVDARAARS